jgi:CRP-like cAMP-binding protein
MRGEPHHAYDLHAASDAALVALAREDLEQILNELVVMLDEQATQQLLWRVPVLRALNEVERANLLSQVGERRYGPGEVILRAGEPVQSFYVVVEGEVLASSPSASSAGGDGAANPVAVLGPVQSFGEAEVGAGLPSPLSYTVATSDRPARLFVVDAETFRLTALRAAARTGGVHFVEPSQAQISARQLPPCASADAAAEREAANAADQAYAGLPEPRKRLGIPFEELEQLATLGTGTFARVRLVHHRKTNRVFALKMLKKAQIVALRQEKNIMNEKEVLMRVDHPFIIKLYDTYKVRETTGREGGGWEV